MNVHRLFLPVYLVLLGFLLLYSCGVKAQEKLKEGDTLTGIAALCENIEDAATLVGLTARYGRNVGLGFMNESDNTCALVPTTAKVGAIEMADIKGKNGDVWTVLGVTVEDKPHFIVIPSAMVATPTSY
jgi:hypothetical protein